MIVTKDDYTESDHSELIKYLLSLKNQKKADFDAKLIPTKYKIIGLYADDVNKIILKYLKPKNLSFILLLPYFRDEYFEEVAIHLNLVAGLQDLSQLINCVDDLADNWALTDGIDTSFISKDLDRSFVILKGSLNTLNDFVVRFVIVCFMKHYLETKYVKEIILILEHVGTANAHYVEMAVAWLLAVLFVKQRDYALEVLKDNVFSRIVINKAISKIRDSYRVSKEDKELVKKFRKK
jgi:3-methyladenine DNA glycosylase AlkD